jgi:hypothetical protein
MRKSLFGVAIAAAFIVVGPMLAAQSFTEHVPTQKDPLRFSAFAVQMEAGMSGSIEIAIERWSTDAERQTLVGLVNTATDKVGGQATLLKAVQDIKPRTGFIRTPNSMGWDLKYAYESKLPDGSRQIVIATDKPIGFGGMAASGGDTVNYPFSLIEMQFPAGSNKGTGKLIPQTSVSVKNGRLEIVRYSDANEPVRLTEITEQKEKAKKN